MQNAFLKKLNDLQGSFVNMGINVSEQIYRSVNSFTNHDQKLAHDVINGDNNINNEEVSLEKEALNLIALQQPVANDFRSIICILKASSDLERMGDHAESISKELLRINHNDINWKDLEKIISDMSLKIREMLESTLNAYIHGDEAEARLVSQDDLIVDKKFVLARNLIVKETESDNNKITLAASYLLVVRLLERIGDHIVNLDGWVVYNHSGKLVELNPGKLEPDLIQKELKDNKDIKHRK